MKLLWASKMRGEGERVGVSERLDECVSHEMSAIASVNIKQPYLMLPNAHGDNESIHTSYF